MAGVEDLPLPVLSELASLALARELARAGRPLGPYTTSGQILTGPGRLLGFIATATTATAIVAALYDGDGTGGQGIADLTAAQNAPLVVGPGDPGIEIRSGLYLDKSAGSPSVYVWFVPE